MLSRIAKSIAFSVYTTGLILLHPALNLPSIRLGMTALGLILLSILILLLTHTYADTFRSLLLLQAGILFLSLMLVLLTRIIPTQPFPSPLLTQHQPKPQSIQDLSQLSFEPSLIMNLTLHPIRIPTYALNRTLISTPHTLLELGIQSILLFLISLAYTLSLPRLPL